MESIRRRPSEHDAAVYVSFDVTTLSFMLVADQASPLDQIRHATPAEPLPRQPERGSRGEQHVRMWKRQLTLSMMSIASGVVLMSGIVALGHADPLAVAIWAPLSLAVNLFAYVALHLGWSLTWKDPTVTQPQIVYSGISVIACYAMAGPMRAVLLSMFGVAMIYAIFALPAKQVRWITAGHLVLLGIVMTVMSRWQPERYPAGEELLTFFQMCVVLPVFAVLAGRLSELSGRLGQQKIALREALQRNVELAERDELTGLLNRRRATELLELCAKQTARGGSFAIVILDIDHFKRINDSHGHAAGDVVLRHFAHVAQSILRDGDVLARWGGEEFLLVLPTDSAASAAALSQRLRERTAATSIALPHGGAVTITVSIGVAALGEGELTSAVLERADAALYRAKAKGRNRVEVD